MVLFVSCAGLLVRRNTVSRIVSTKCPGTVDYRRFKSTKQAQAPPQVSSSQPGYIAKRKREEIQTKWRKRFPQYRPMPPSQLPDEIYTGTTPLKLPYFRDSIGQDSDSIGKAVEILPTENDPLRIFGVPRNLLLEFRLLSKPYTVIRKVTKEALDILEAAQSTSSLENRWVLTGQPGCGKSFLLLQAVEHAIQKDWVVIYIPRGVNLVDCTTTHIYDLRTQTYLQPKYAFQLLQRMSTVNKSSFEHIHLQNEIHIEKQVIPTQTSLLKTIRIALDESKRNRSYASAPAVLEGVMRALDAQTKYPVLLAVDQLQALYGKTLYRDQHFVPINSYHLSMPRLILEYASGRRNFALGAFFGATSTSQTTNPLPVELRDALELEEFDTRVVTEYHKRNRTMIEYTQGLRKLDVPAQLTVEEAVGIFEIWKGMKVFGTEKTFYDQTFLGKFTESGGNPREFVQNGILSSFDA